jgi:hypothetical protein
MWSGPSTFDAPGLTSVLMPQPNALLSALPLTSLPRLETGPRKSIAAQEFHHVEWTSAGQ